MRRLTILIATVGALLLVPATQAFAAGTATVEIIGKGSGEITSVEGLAKWGGAFESFPGDLEGSPAIECEYASPGPQTGQCSNEMGIDEEGVISAEDEGTALRATAAPGSTFTGWIEWEGSGSPHSLATCYGSLKEMETVFKGTGKNSRFPDCLATAKKSIGGTTRVVAAFCLEGETRAQCLGLIPLTVTAPGALTGDGVTSSPLGINCGSASNSICSYEYQSGAEVTLTAKTGGQSREFAGWAGSGCSGTGTCTVTMSEAREVTAEFVPTPTLTVSKSGTGSGTVASTPAGIICGSTCSANYAKGTEVTLNATAALGSEFTGWSGSGCSGTGTCIVTMSESKSVTANFDEEGPAGPPLTLNIQEGEGTVVSNPAGLECTGSAPKACTTESIAEGSVTLTASPAPGYAFKSWKKCDSGGVNGRQCTITLSSAKEVGAKFVKTWNLDVSKAGSGTGKAQTSPGGILCLYNCGSAEAAFKEGSVTIKQAPAKHNHFVQWLGDCTGSAETCVLSMNEDHSVEAEFAPDTQHTLSISKEGGGQASIKSSPSGVLCGYTCGSQTASFYSGETVSIAVTLNKGTTSLEWTTEAGTCTGSALTCTVPMSAAKTLVAKLS